MRLPRPRLTLRVLLLLVAVIATVLGLQLKRQRDVKRAIEAIEAKGGIICHDNELAGRREPSWFRQLMGESPFDDLYSVSMNSDTFTDDDVEYLALLPSTKVLSLAGSNITDNAMRTIARLPNLEVLDVCYTHVTNAGMQSLRTCRTLRQLHTKKVVSKELRIALPTLQVYFGEHDYKPQLH